MKEESGRLRPEWSKTQEDRARQNESHQPEYRDNEHAERKVHSNIKRYTRTHTTPRSQTYRESAGAAENADCTSTNEFSK